MGSCLSVQLSTVSPMTLAPASLWRGIYQLHITSIITLLSVRHFNIFSSGILSHYQSLSAVLQDSLLGRATARARNIGPGHSLLGLYIMLASSSVALLELNLIVASLERACPVASYYRVYTNHLHTLAASGFSHSRICVDAIISFQLRVIYFLQMRLAHGSVISEPTSPCFIVRLT
jgi:hypothetical protein